MNSIVRFACCAAFTTLTSCLTVASLVAVENEADDRAVENIAQFARLYGYVRFFHPSEQAVSVDWDKFAIFGVQAVRGVENDEKLRRALRQLFEPLCIGLRVSSAADLTAVNAKSPRPPETDRLTYWQYYGVRFGAQSNTYRSRRVIEGTEAGPRSPVFRPAQAPPKSYQRLIGSDTVVELPLVLPVSAEEKTALTDPMEYVALQQGLASLNTRSLTATDWQLRVAGVITAWNVFQHFHPYIDRIGLNWEEVLRPTLRRALTDKTGTDYFATMKELVARLQDGHGHVTGPVPLQGGLPIRVEVVEGQVVVTGVAEDAPFKKADVIAKIDGVDALELLAQREHHVSGSPQLRRYRALNQFGEGPVGSGAQIEILRDGVAQQLTIKRLQDRRGFFFNPIYEFEFPAFAELRPGIYYVNIARLGKAKLVEKLSMLERSRGVIFDNRSGGPSRLAQNDFIQPSDDIIPHLIDKTIDPSPMLVPKVTQPDRVGWILKPDPQWTVEPKAPRINAQVVFINEPHVVSYGETCMAMIVHYGLAKLVGGPTAGCNGNVNYVHLPGGFQIMWTGMEVTKHDGSQLYLTGFVPDYPVTRTIQAVKESRDEYLEKAIAVSEQLLEPTKQ